MFQNCFGTPLVGLTYKLGLIVRCYATRVIRISLQSMSA